LAQIKSVLERRLPGLSAIRFGGEYLVSKDKTDFSNTYVSNAKNQFEDHFSAAFAEADIYVTNDLAAKIGGRLENSSYLNKSNLVPRISLAYKVGMNAQVSMAYGIFYQKPDKLFLMFQNNLTTPRPLTTF
jgi:outer membrane receptor for ferrienterochelin and colicin